MGDGALTEAIRLLDQVIAQLQSRKDDFALEIKIIETIRLILTERIFGLPPLRRFEITKRY
jgi:hypothetical protein